MNMLVANLCLLIGIVMTCYSATPDPKQLLLCQFMIAIVVMNGLRKGGQ